MVACLQYFSCIGPGAPLRRHCGHGIETGYSPSFTIVEMIILSLLSLNMTGIRLKSPESRDGCSSNGYPQVPPKIKALGINYFARQNCRSNYYSIQPKELSVFEEVSAFHHCVHANLGYKIDPYT